MARGEIRSRLQVAMGEIRARLQVARVEIRARLQVARGEIRARFGPGCTSPLSPVGLRPPKKPSATAVHDGEQSRRSGSGAYSRADRGRRWSFSWLGVTDVQTYCGTHMRTPGDCRQVLCVPVRLQVRPGSPTSMPPAVRALCVAVSPRCLLRYRAMEGAPRRAPASRRSAGRGFCANGWPILSR